MGKKSAIVSGILKNEAKIAEFALTNICTARCDFCSIWQQKEKHTVSTEDAVRTISQLYDLGIRFITLTGGEPLLHPDFEAIIKECTRVNMMSSILNADARLINEKRLDILERAETDLVCISVDHHEDEVVSASRKIPGLLGHIETATKELKKRKIKTMASTLIWKKNRHSLRELFQKCESMGFDLISVNYPEFSQSPVYTLGGDAIDITKEDLICALEEVIQLKKEFNLANTPTSMRNIISYLKGETPQYTCLGGYRAVFVDWNLEMWPCMHLGRSMGKVSELKKSDFKKKPCNCCNMSWYRDFSIYFQGLKSIRPLLEGVQFLKGFGISN